MGFGTGQWKELAALFDEALDLPPPRRQALLGELAARDPDLSDRLARMLAGVVDPDATVAATPAQFDQQLARALAEPELPPAQAGDRFGAWRLMRLLGEGGMGEVWLAERADGLYEGQAAIKLLRGDIAGPGLAARFARERVLLGRLTHPGIARLLDAGEQQGRAYLVLEHVLGETLSEHVRKQGLNLNDRVRLLLAVARAVEHAHAQLIVHRDLKPSNVMVDRNGQTKLLDFGVAGLLNDQGEQDDNQITLVGGRRITPAYAAPEQISGGAVGVATDVYSLGVMLFELATGVLPFGGRDRNRTALEHDVVHTAAPRLSTGLSSPGEVDAQGPGRPADARRARGDLEAVAAKAMRKLPVARYASVGALIDDLQRWLDQRPVSVRSEDWRHRLALWARRNAALAIGGTLVVAALSAGLGVSLWQRREAQAAARQSEEVTSYLTELLASANPDSHGGRIPNIFEVLEKSRAELRQRFAHDDLTYTRVLDVMVATYSDMNRHDIAIPLAQELIAESTRLWGPEHPRTLSAQLRLARIYTALGSPLEVIEIGEKLLPLIDPGPGKGSDDFENLLYQLIVAYAQSGRFEEAEAVRERAWGLVQKRYPPQDYEYAFFGAYVYTLRMNQGRLQDAEAVIQPVVAAGAQAAPRFARFVQRTRQHLWNVQASLGRPEATVDAALTLIAEMDHLLGPGNSSSQRMRGDLAAHLVTVGDYAQAAQIHTDLEVGLPEAAALHPNLRLPRETGALLAKALAHPEHRAQLLTRARTLAAELRAGQGLSGPRWAEAGVALVRVGLALRDLDLARLALAPLQDLAAQPWLRRHEAWHTRIEQLAGELARAEGQPRAGLTALRQRVALLDRLPQPQGMAHWTAQLDLAASLQAAGAPEAPEALARADALRPAWLGPHPLDALRSALTQGGNAAAWAGQF